MRYPATVAACGLVLAAGFWGGTWWSQRNLLPGFETVMVEEGGVEFLAQLDTGVTVSSINAQGIEVIGGGDEPSREDAGKLARFDIVNASGECATVSAEIAEVRGIRNTDCRELRYHVYLTVKHRGKSYRVLTNLNDRSGSKRKLLLGRNWLCYGFTADAARAAQS